MHLKTITDARGSLTVIERLPFDIKRVYYLHHIDPQATRGGHAHRALRRLMVAVSGGFVVEIRSRKRCEDIILNDPAVGVLIEPMEWITLHSFREGSICMVLASMEHDEADCIRDMAEWARLAGL